MFPKDPYKNTPATPGFTPATPAPPSAMTVMDSDEEEELNGWPA